MSSQENHLNSGEVVISPESHSGVDAVPLRDSTNYVEAQAQPEVDAIQAPVVDDEEVPAALSARGCR